jgi:hypothetical protein
MKRYSVSTSSCMLTVMLLYGFLFCLIRRDLVKKNGTNEEISRLTIDVHTVG